MKKNFRIKNMEGWSKSYGTLAIISINIMVFIALKAFPNITNELVLNPYVEDIIKRPWTLVSVFFSHEAPIHIISNMALILFFGTALEKVTNAKTIIIVYMISGFIGSLTFIPVAPLIGYTTYATGASAAAFGIVAAYGAMRPDTKIAGYKAITWTYTLFAVNAFLTIAAVLKITNIDSAVGSAAHAVGIIIGLIYGYMLRKKTFSS